MDEKHEALKVLMSEDIKMHDEAWVNFHRRHVEALAAAGLLRTGLEKRAVEAWKDWASHEACRHNGCKAAVFDKMSTLIRCQALKDGLTIGREAIAAEEMGKPRYAVIPRVEPSGMWRVAGPRPMMGPHCDVAYFVDESDARAYCRQKNEARDER